jgi:hypothetical protein
MKSLFSFAQLPAQLVLWTRTLCCGFAFDRGLAVYEPGTRERYPDSATIGRRGQRSFDFLRAKRAGAYRQLVRARLAERILGSASPVLVSGGERSARTRLLIELAAELERLGSEATVVTADIGLPFLGPPGAVTRLRHSGGAWAIERIEPLCTLDAARFRLPLLLACRRALQGDSGAPVLVEIPRLTRGMSASEILTGTVEALDATTVLALGSLGELRSELEALGAEVLELEEETGPPLDRASARTTLWNEFLHSASEAAFALKGLPLLGAPPPLEASSAFPGRQIGVLGPRGEALAFGEILSVENGTLRARVRPLAEGEPRSLLVRDARRDDQGLLSTDRPVEPSSAVEAGDLDRGRGATPSCAAGDSHGKAR